MNTRMRAVMSVVMATITTGLMGAASAQATTGHGVLATYHGGTIDLGKGWGGAQVCAELAQGDVRCFDTVREAGLVTERRAATVRTMAAPDCPSGWVCLYQDKNYRGRRLMWSQPGTKKLAQWGFRDKTSSAAVVRPQGGVECVDYRSFQPDPRLFLAAGSAYSDFTRISYVYGGSWNDRVDEIRM